MMKMIVKNESWFQRIFRIMQFYFFFRNGIIGEPLSQFNSITLTPLGAENEEEENEDGEERKQEWVTCTTRMDFRSDQFDDCALYDKCLK